MGAKYDDAIKRLSDIDDALNRKFDEAKNGDDVTEACVVSYAIVSVKGVREALDGVLSEKSADYAASDILGGVRAVHLVEQLKALAKAMAQE